MSIQKLLLQVYDAHPNYLGGKSLPTLKGNIDEIIAGFFCPGPFYYYIIDSPSLTLEHASETSREFFGFHLKGISLSSLAGQIHPDDMDFFLRCEHIVADFLQNKIPSEKVVNYKISYCLREKMKDGSYRLFLIQTVTLQTTEEGSLLKVLGVHSDITHITHVNNYKLSFIGLNGEPSYLGIDVMNICNSSLLVSDGNPFTKREIEVIKLLGEGQTSREIAEKLFVSDETVISHRKNALAKAGLKNSTQLVAYCIRQGYI